MNKLSFFLLSLFLMAQQAVACTIITTPDDPTYIRQLQTAKYVYVAKANVMMYSEPQDINTGEIKFEIIQNLKGQRPIGWTFETVNFWGEPSDIYNDQSKYTGADMMDALPALEPLIDTILLSPKKMALSLLTTFKL